MPPKKQSKKEVRGQEKAVERQKIKVAEDKTFGLKNKNKSKTVQKFIKGVQSTAVGGTKKGGESAELARQITQKEEKKKAQQQALLMASLFKGHENIKKIALDESAPKVTTCPDSIKAGQKIDIYQDQREQKEMDDWDTEKLNQVVSSKHAAQAGQCDIICKHFLDALEKRLYGWFWICPNGGDKCKYRHALPPGFVLKSKAPVTTDEEDEEPIEERIERLRRELPPGGTPVTMESFQAWKKKLEDDRKEAVEAARQAEAKKTGGRGTGVLSGRDLFTFDPTLFVDAEGAADDDDYDEDEEGLLEQEEAEEAAARANAPSLSSGEGEEDEEVAEGSEIAVGKAELFLDDDVPDDLDELDD